ncbi:hypothetical protein [Xanthomonas albilineans]|uniref:hypothetical protein n=1 Tax=Xanthomonas albilineans TaxID=29447 RepID=UPI0005F316F1|nr:hypothetical protein [Xanthomonas albilineans]
MDRSHRSASLSAMRCWRCGLCGHGSKQYFGSKSPDNGLVPHRFSETSQRYVDHQTAFKHFSRELFHERGALSQALRQICAHSGLAICQRTSSGR